MDESLGWKSPDDVPIEHLKKIKTGQTHHLNMNVIGPKEPVHVTGKEFKYHIDIDALVEYIRPKLWLHGAQLAVEVSSFGFQEMVAGVALLFDGEESDYEFQKRCKQYQHDKFKAAQVLRSLTEQEERELFERLKGKYGNQ
jgi:hypothetical protein